MDWQNQDLVKLIHDLQARVEKLEAEAEVRKLHHKYGYYLDKCRFSVRKVLLQAQKHNDR